MTLVIIALLTLPLQYTTCYKPERLLGRMEREEWFKTYTFVQRTDLWKACSYHFSSSRVLSIAILNSMSENFKLFVKCFMPEVQRLDPLH
jgi:SRSO17 transposase